MMILEKVELFCHVYLKKVHVKYLLCAAKENIAFRIQNILCMLDACIWGAFVGREV